MLDRPHNLTSGAPLRQKESGRVTNHRPGFGHLRSIGREMTDRTNGRDGSEHLHFATDKGADLKDHAAD